MVQPRWVHSRDHNPNLTRSRPRITQDIESQTSLCIAEHNNTTAIAQNTLNMSATSRLADARRVHHHQQANMASFSFSLSGSSAPRQHNRTGFLNLPRELRDAIYDLAFRETQGEHVLTCKHQEKRGTVCFIRRTPLLQLRLVSRQINLEYDQRLPANNRLSVSTKQIDKWRCIFYDITHVTTARPVKIDITVPICLHASSRILNEVCVARYTVRWMSKLYYDTSLLSGVDTFVIRLHYTGRANQMFADILKDLTSLDYRLRYKGRIDAFMYGLKLEGPLTPTAMSLLWSADESGKPIEFATWTPMSGFKAKEGIIAVSCVAMSTQ